MSRVRSLREIQAEEDWDVRTASQIAAKSPRTTEEALAAWLFRQREAQAAGLSKIPDYEARVRGARHSALTWLAEQFEIDLDAKDPGAPEPKAKSRGLRRRPAKGESPDEIRVNLGKLLTPHGWEDDHGAKLRKLVELEREAVFQGDDIARHQARLYVVERLQRFLVRTASDARRAKRKSDQVTLKRMVGNG